MPATQRLILKVAVDATLHRRVNSWVVTFSVMLATFMEILDTTAVNVSIPHIAGNLSATVEEGTWVVTSYLVSNAIVLPISGWPANYMGRRQLWHRHHDRVSHAAHASTPESLDGESAGGKPGNHLNVAGVTTLVSCERKRQLHRLAQSSRRALRHGAAPRHHVVLRGGFLDHGNPVRRHAAFVAAAQTTKGANTGARPTRGGLTGAGSHGKAIGRGERGRTRPRPLISTPRSSRMAQSAQRPWFCLPPRRSGGSGR